MVDKVHVLTYHYDESIDILVFKTVAGAIEERRRIIREEIEQWTDKEEYAERSITELEEMWEELTGCSFQIYEAELGE